MEGMFTASVSGGGRTVKVAKYDVTLNHTTFDKLDKKMQKGLLEMAYEIQERAKGRVPVVTGALRSSIRVEPPTQTGVEIVAGGGFYSGDDGVTKYIGYAWKREQGPNRNPATEHYMELAGKDIIEADGGNYIKKFFK